VIAKSYPAYKRSKIEWVGLIPSHWPESRLSDIASVKARLGWKGLKAEEYVPSGFALLATPNIKDTDIDFQNVNFVTQERFDESPEIILREGDVLLVKDGSTLGISNVVRHLPCPATVNGSIAVIRPNDRVDSVFLHYFFQSGAFQAEIERMKGGMGVPHLFQADLRKFGVIAPPLTEQQSIASFLDRETAKIDALIAKQTEFLTRLDEHRSALVAAAVTNGLDASVPILGTGIEAFPFIPAHWSMKPLNALIRSGTSITYGIVQAGPDVLNGIPYIRTSDMNGNKLPETGYLRTSPEIAAAYTRSRVQAADLVMAIRATVGKTLPVPEWLDGANLTQGTARIAPGRLVSADYLLYVLNSPGASQGLDAVSKGATFKEITLEMLRKFRVPVPPRDEQATITRYLDARLTQLGATHERCTRIITTLRERRAALITAAVTGQVEVSQPALAEAVA
jgi:type I restriction enzyme S subunit